MPNRVINALLRVAVGIAFLAFPDNDIKEFGDRWEGIEDDEPTFTEIEVQNMISEAIDIAHACVSWPGNGVAVTVDELKELLPKGTRLTKNQLALALKDLCDQKAKTAALEEVTDPAQLDRFSDIERALARHGLSINLHNNYFRNLWLGTGIITIWSGMEEIFNATFLSRRVPHTGANSLIRIVVAAGLLFLLDGNINSFGDGQLDEESNDGALSPPSLCAAITGQLYQCHTEKSPHDFFEHARHHRVGQAQLLSLLPQGTVKISSAELVRLLARFDEKEETPEDDIIR